MSIIKQVEGLKPNGHYALAVVDGGRIYVSGQFSVSLGNGEKVFGTVEDEAKRVLSNIDKILKAAGSSAAKILKSTVYVDDLKNWDKINDIYSSFFKDHIHARTIICVKELHYGFKLEMDVIAGF